MTDRQQENKVENVILHLMPKSKPLATVVLQKIIREGNAPVKKNKLADSLT